MFVVSGVLFRRRLVVLCPVFMRCVSFGGNSFASVELSIDSSNIVESVFRWFAELLGENCAHALSCWSLCTPLPPPVFLVSPFDSVTLGITSSRIFDSVMDNFCELLGLAPLLFLLSGLLSHPSLWQLFLPATFCSFFPIFHCEYFHVYFVGTRTCVCVCVCVVPL